MKTSENLIFAYFMGVSLIGLLFLPGMVFWAPVSVNSHWQRYLIFSIFGLVCFLGVLVGVFPSKFQKKSKSQNKSGVKFRGHHPDCGNFSGHVIQLADKTYCSGCTGLIIGAIVAISGTLLYLTRGLPSENGSMVFWAGFTGVLIGLVYNGLSRGRLGFLNLFVNVIFVLGAFMLLFSIEKINGNLLSELYLLILIPNWIITRILSSQREHDRICGSCDLKKCME